MSRPVPPRGAGATRVADVVCGSATPLSSAEIAARLGLGMAATRRYLTALKSIGVVALVGAANTARWTSSDRAPAAQAEYDAALAVRKYPRVKRATERSRWQSGQPIRVVSTEWSAGEVRGPNSVFALGGGGTQ